MSNECIFCKIVKGDMPSDKVFENEDFLVIRDVNPKVEGHMLVISKRHFGSFVEMDSGLDGALLKVVREVVVQESLKDFNLVMNNGRDAGQIIPHFHLHILPRVAGDKFGLGV